MYKYFIQLAFVFCLFFIACDESAPEETTETVLASIPSTDTTATSDSLPVNPMDDPEKFTRRSILAINEMVFPKFLPRIDHSEWYHYPQIIQKKSYVYAEPDSNSSVIDTLYWQQHLQKLDRSFPYKNPDSYLYSHVHYKDSLKGYVKKTDVAVYTLGNRSNTRRFGIGSKKIKGGDKVLQILTIENSSRTVIDRFEMYYRNDDYRLRPVYNFALKNINSIIHIDFYRTGGCPGTSNDVFLMTKGDTFEELIQSMSMGEAGYYDHSIIYLPIQFENGKILLVAYGNIELIFNRVTGDLNVYPYPEELGVPIEELIVVEHEEGETLYDEDYKQIFTQEGKNKVKIEKKDTRFFRWDGQKLKKIKEIVYK